MLPDLVSNSVDYMNIANAYKVNGGQSEFYSAATIAAFENATDRTLFPNTDWLDLVYGNPAGMQSHQFSVNGGTEKSRFNLSFNYLDQDGVVDYTNSKKYGFRANFDSKVSDKFSFGVDISGNRSDITSPGSVAWALTAATSTNPMVIPILDGQYGGPNTLEDGDLYNARQEMDTNRDIREEYSLRGKIFAKYTFTENLSLELNLATNYGHKMRTTYETTWEKINFLTNTVAQRNTIMDLTDRMSRSIDQTVYSLLRYDKTFFDKHNVNFLAGFSQEEYNYDYLSGYKKEFMNNSLFELDAAVDENSMIARGSESENSLRSFFSTLDYIFDGKYLLGGVVRYDGSSKFSKENRWGFFPAVSGAWIMSEESFMDNIGMLNYLKLRGSWSKVGNNRVPNYAYIPTYGLGTNYSFGGVFVPGMAITEVVNPDLKWETTVEKNLGFDATFFGGLISLSADYFDKETRDMIETVSIPYISGLAASSPSKNIGTMSNKGFEFELNHKHRVNNLFYSVNLVLSTFKNELVKYNENVDQISGGFILRQGESVYSLYGYEYEGIFQTQAEVDAHAFQNTVTSAGDLIYKDQLTVDTDGDGVPDEADGIINGDDRVILGSSLPKFTYGINLNLEYKGLNLSAIFSGSHGSKGYLRGQMMYPLSYPDRGTFITDWMDHWTPDNTDATIPKPSAYSLYTAHSDFWMHNISYLKLKNVKLGYTLPLSISNKLRLSELNFFVNAENLFTISNFPHTDPERGQRTTGISYPLHKTYSFGIQVNF